MAPEQLLAVERALLAGVLSEDAWNEALMRLAGLAGAAYLAIMTRDAWTGQFHVLEPVEVSPRLIEDYEAHFRALNPMNSMKVLSSDGEQYLDWTVLGHDFIKRAAYYQEFMRTYDLGHLMAHRVDIPGGPDCILSIHKLADEAAFDAGAAAAISAAHGALQHTLTLRHRLRGLQQAQVWQRTALDALSFPIMLVDGWGQVHQANRAAEAWLSSPACPLSTRNGGPDRQALLDIIRQARGSAKQPPRLASLRLSFDARHAGTTCVAIPAGDDDAPAQGSDTALLMVWPASPREPARALLRQVFGLSPAEARVAALLARGLAPREIAALKALGETTVRSHIKSIFRKMHVHRQHELARLLTELSLVDADPGQGPALPNLGDAGNGDPA